MSRGRLVVFAKAPRPGLVKTRMNPPLSLEECADLYREMLIDVLSATARFSVALDLEPVVACHPPDALDEWVEDIPNDFRVEAQRGPNLGQRMAHIVAEAEAFGCPHVLIRGSDSPALPLDRFREVVAQLRAGADVAITPDQSGGYALIGMRRFEPGIFDVPMSTESNLDLTVRRASELGLSTALTTPGFDLDTVGDLQLLEQLSDEEKSDLCPRTVQRLTTSSLRRVL